MAALSEILEQRGLVLQTELVSLLAGEPIHGSWWGHAMAKEIFAALLELSETGNALTAKLIDGKVTFVHRRLWSALLALGLANEDWQFQGLSSDGAALLRRVEEAGELRASGAAAAELERALLVHAAQVHTESGGHAKILESWTHWMKRTGVMPFADPAHARGVLAEAALGTGKLPWE